jgi:hypothetical protein
LRAAGGAPASTLTQQRTPPTARCGRADGAALDLHEGIGDPLPDNACARWPEHLRLVNETTLNYVPRDTADGKFVESLTRDKHVVVFGSSKQGKTCLRKYNLTDGDYIIATCSNTWNLAALHSAILKAAGFTVEQSERRTETGSTKIAAKAGIKFGLGGVGLEAGGG